jgi:hypothetical protein
MREDFGVGEWQYHGRLLRQAVRVALAKGGSLLNPRQSVRMQTAELFLKELASALQFVGVNMEDNAIRKEQLAFTPLVPFGPQQTRPAQTLFLAHLVTLISMLTPHPWAPIDQIQKGMGKGKGRIGAVLKSLTPVVINVVSPAGSGKSAQIIPGIIRNLLYVWFEGAWQGAKKKNNHDLLEAAKANVQKLIGPQVLPNVNPNPNTVLTAPQAWAILESGPKWLPVNTFTVLVLEPTPHMRTAVERACE